MQKQTAIDLVSNNISSIYTKEDVLKLIEGIETEGGLDFDINALIEHVQDTIGNMNDFDIVDTDSAEFSLDGSTIQLDSINVDNHNIECSIDDSIREFFDNQ
jgi:hypothetical protein